MSKIRQSIGKIRANLILTAAWGLMEVFILRSLQFLGKFFPNIHRYFMRFMHGYFGAVVIPFENALESDPEKRTWESREEWVKLSAVPRLKRGKVTILPNQEVLNLVLRLPLDINVADCLCRKMAKEQHQICTLNAPLDTCLTLKLPHSVEMALHSKPTEAQLKRKKELYELLKKCDEIGLVHQVVFLPFPNYTYVICNCCPCCCEVIHGFKEAQRENQIYEKRLGSYRGELKKLESLPLSKSISSKKRRIKRKMKPYQKAIGQGCSPLEVQSSFIARTVDYVNCIHCGNCVKRCYFDSRTMVNGTMTFRPELCYGCGLCVSTCPTNNIRLDKRWTQKKMAKTGKGIGHTHPHTLSLS